MGWRRAVPVLCGGAALLGVTAGAQQEPVATVATAGALVQHVASVTDGRASVENNGVVAALDKTVKVQLARGGELQVCATTAVHIARQTSVGAANNAQAGLMFSLDRGAFEADYKPALYSDVILTPDLRLLISGPGQVQLKIRVNEQGDTCVDNGGANAPYVVASSLMDGGLYRIRAGQRVLFIHGSLQQVVDNEREPCGCPPAAPLAESAAKGAAPGGPSSTPADTAFPTAVSEGLAPPPAEPSTPVVPPGTVHAQVTATLSSSEPPGPPPPGESNAPPVGPATAAASPTPAAVTPRAQGGFLHRIGHFFARIFGAE